MKRRTTQHWNLLGNVSSNKRFKLHRALHLVTPPKKTKQGRACYIQSLALTSTYRSPTSSWCVMHWVVVWVSAKGEGGGASCTIFCTRVQCTEGVNQLPVDTSWETWDPKGLVPTLQHHQSSSASHWLIKFRSALFLSFSWGTGAKKNCIPKEKKLLNFFLFFYRFLENFVSHYFYFIFIV